MKKIFISSPYTNGNQADNVREQIDAASKLIDAGFAPYLPLYTHFLHIFKSQDYETWMKLHSEYLLCCDAVLRLPGISKGADREVALAAQKDIPVFYDLNKLLYELH